MKRPDEYLRAVTDETMRKQPADSPVKRWFLLDGNRWTIAGLLLVGFFTAFFVLGRFGIISVEEQGPVAQLFHVLAVGNFTVIGLVITINQLVLSREFGSIDTFRERAAGVKQFRRDVEEATDTDVSPAQPTDFLRLVIIAIRKRATRIEELATESSNEAFEEHVDAYVDTIIEYTDQMDDILERTRFGTFNALSAMLNYNDAWQIHAARRIYHEHADDVSEDTTEAFEEMVEILELFGIARAYFKTLYMEQELAKLSRVLFYVGVPSLFVAGTSILLYGSEVGTTISDTNLHLVVSVAATISTAPVAVLFAYAIRIATVATRTPSIGSFHTGHQRVIQESD